MNKKTNYRGGKSKITYITEGKDLLTQKWIYI